MKDEISQSDDKLQVKIIHNRQAAYEFLKNKCRYDYLYQFYDLEEKNWENVICYGLFDDGEIKQIAIIAINYGIPVLIAASYQDIEYNIILLRQIKKFLPTQFYTHIDKETLNTVFREDKISELQEYMNMGYEEMVDVELKDSALRIGYKQLVDIKDLLSQSYPEAWLDDELVKLNRNFGIYNGDKLVSFAGIHAYSDEYQVAAVAHVTTHPDYRRMGYGEIVVSSLIKDLKNDIKYIGLNVKTDNYTAINCYKNLGFKEYGKFVGCEISI
jgi:ribosomal protein S18 acetylase RimI-like enzyme